MPCPFQVVVLVLCKVLLLRNDSAKTSELIGCSTEREKEREGERERLGGGGGGGRERVKREGSENTLARVTTG